MAQFLSTMLFSNDLGFATRMIPIAGKLASRGYGAALCNLALAPAQLITEAGMDALPLPHLPRSTISGASPIWDVGCLFTNIGLMDETCARAMTAMWQRERYSAGVTGDGLRI
jgi:hypothetical protein